MTSTTATTEVKLDRDPHRLLQIAANLLPTEITDARRENKVRWFVLALLVVVVGALVAWDVHARQLTNAAQDKLTTTQDEARAINRQQNQAQYRDLSVAKNQTQALTGKLTQVMAQDLPWWQLIPSMNAAADAAKVSITDFSGGLDSPSGGNGAAVTSNSNTQLPGITSSSEAGLITINGTSPDKLSVAAFLDALGKTTGFADPYVTQVIATNGTYRFTVQVEFTNVLFKGRFSQTPADTTGGN